MKREPGCTPRDVFLAITTLSFDIAALELYLPLITGARLVIASRQTARDGPLLDKEIERCGATMMQATPSGWQLLIESGWRGDRRLTALCGGEAISEHLATRLLERTAGLWNMYGPTETTIWSLIHRVERPEPHIPIGRPINNTTVYILGPAGDIVPPGAAGELHIGGEGLARGYFGRSDLTTDRFIPNPLPECSGERLYKTGDLARWRRNGLIECLGRTDNQIKIRGYRIELGEVEAALRACPDVVDAVVAAREDHRGGKRLVGYVQTKLGSAPSLPEEIRRLVRERLPDYMVPAFIIPLNEFPKTANNKIDRKLLPDPVRESIVSECVAHVAPRDELEERLAAIWLDVLGLKNIGIRDNFFELGGHSLLAARLFAAIEHVTGSHIPLATLFRSPTIEDLAKTIRGGEWKVDWKPVVELKRGQSAPFFCIHSLGANLVSYKRLSMLLDADQQFYGLQPHGLDGKEEPHARIPDMAQAYLAEVRRIQPHGPWFLGGVCLGGVIAYEMAQQLKSQGEEIGLLLMIDSEYPAQPPYQRTRNHNLFIADWHAGEIMRLEAGHRWPYVRKKLGKAVRRIRVRNGDGGSFERAVERIRAANLKALSEYRPQPYDGKITLLWSSEASARCYEDRRLSWSAVARGLEVHVVPGNHLTMIEPPNLEVLASKMNSCLQSAREMCGRALPEEARVTAASA
jgi:thioesterase domain-containing protein/acyl carrier protein